MHEAGHSLGLGVTCQQWDGNDPSSGVLRTGRVGNKEVTAEGQRHYEVKGTARRGKAIRLRVGIFVSPTSEDIRPHIISISMLSSLSELCCFATKLQRMQIGGFASSLPRHLFLLLRIRDHER